jgi:fumarate hydratase class II
MSTALVPSIGYEKAAEISGAAYETGRTVREMAIEKQVLAEDEVHRLLDRLIRGGA